jgi:hypothetical protein
VPLLRNYVNDAATIAGLDTRDDFTRSGDVNIAIDESRTALGQLRTSGRARRWLEARAGRLEAERDRLAKIESEQDAREMAAKAAAEADQLADLRKALPGFRAGYRFAEACTALRGLRLISAQNAAEQDLLVWFWQGGEDFLASLAEDLTKFGYRGNFQPRDGAVTYRDVRITRATRTTLVLEGGAVGGVASVPLAQVPAGQLVSLGMAMLEKVEGEEALQARRQALAHFSRHADLNDVAERLAGQLAGDRNFAERWEKLAALLAAPVAGGTSASTR